MEGDPGAAQEEGDDGQPLTVAELLSELLYAGKTLSEIAGYDDVQMNWVVCRQRDDRGRLQRGNEQLPPGVHVDDDGMRVVKSPSSYAAAFAKASSEVGVAPDLAKQRWQEFLEANPRCGVGGIE